MIIIFLNKKKIIKEQLFFQGIDIHCLPNHKA